MLVDRCCGLLMVGVCVGCVGFYYGEVNVFVFS